jgi:FkbH-like protein
LAEGDTLLPHQNRFDIVRQLNERGVVNSICSKNDFERAKVALEDFNLWSEFVFPEIQMEAKGQVVKSIIADMQLRAPDVIFIDDNDSNLREVAFFNEGIQLLDANDPETDKKLAEWVDGLPLGRSRVDEYRQLEAKRDAKQSSGLDNHAFLETCNIRVALVRRSDNLSYAARIEELINRTNQMNFTKSRVEAGSMAEYVIEPKHETYSVFVWDNFGFYGLVGFAAIEEKSKLVHLAYSCRIMNMGVEQAVGLVIKKTFKPVNIPHPMFDAPWIKLVDAANPEFQRLLAKELEAPAAVSLRVMANCQSGALVHYLGTPGADWDNWPRIFKLEEMLSNPASLSKMEKFVYGAFNDYDDRYWQAPPSVDTYRKAAEAMTSQVLSYGSIMVIILPRQHFKEQYPYGVTPDRFAGFNSVWRDLAKQHPASLKVVEIAELSDEAHGDPRHFSPTILRDAAHASKGFLKLD